MVSKDKKHIVEKNKKFSDSFKHAYDGVIYALFRERNMHVHFIMAVLVIICGVFFNISYVEWLVCLILIALVIILELLNTAIEAVVDMITTEESKLAKVAKDTSAGAVLVASMVSAFIGLIIFIPKGIDFIMNL